MEMKIDRYAVPNQEIAEIYVNGIRDGMVVLTRDIYFESRARLGSMGTFAPVQPMTVAIDGAGRTVEWDRDCLDEAVQACERAGGIAGAFEMRHEESMGKLRGAVHVLKAAQA